MIIDDITPDQPTLDPEVERGWYVGTQDDTFVITFLDGRPPIVGQTAAIEFYTNNQSQEDNNMPSNEANYMDAAAQDATGLIEKYTEPAMLFIGQSAKSASEIMRAKRPWNELARSEVLGRVTLDLEPEMRGRPQPGRPGVSQVVFMALPSWHPLFRAGVQEVAALLYTPSTTYLAEQIVGGAIVKEPRASSYDVTGWEGIAAWFGDLESAEEERTALWTAVKDLARSTYGEDGEQEEPVDQFAGRYGTAASWGV